MDILLDTPVHVLPLEIVSIILSKLDNGDLLNSRLVCKSWNVECLLHLRQTFTKYLDGRSLSVYLKSENDHPPKFLPILPFFTLEYSNTDEMHDCDLVQFIKDLVSLVKMYGTECVSVLKISKWINNTQELDALLEILNNVSLGINKLDVNITLKIDIEVQNQNWKFPVLKCITLNQWRNAMPSPSTPLCDIGRLYHKIIECSPNLISLELDHESLHSCFQMISFQKLKTLKTRDCYLPELIQRIKSSEPTQLRNLTLASIDENTVIWNLFSKSLLNLCITISGSGIRTIHAPVFPCLQYLRLECPLVTVTRPIFLAFDNFNILTFPALKTVDIPFRYFLREPESANAKLSKLSSICHNNVINLIVRINNSPITSPFNSEQGNYSIQQNVKHLHQIFPNICKLTIYFSASFDGNEEFEMRREVTQEFFVVYGSGSFIQEINVRIQDSQDYQLTVEMLEEIKREISSNIYFKIMSDCK